MRLRHTIHGSPAAAGLAGVRRRTAAGGGRVSRPAGACLLAAVLGLGAAGARAEDCRIEARPVEFGTLWNLEREGARAEGLILVDCPVAAGGARVSLGSGLNSARPDRRELAADTASLRYNLYVDAARRQVWGDGRGGTGIAVVPARGLLTVYADIAPGQRAVPGHYADTVEITIDW